MIEGLNEDTDKGVRRNCQSEEGRAAHEGMKGSQYLLLSSQIWGLMLGQETCVVPLTQTSKRSETI